MSVTVSFVDPVTPARLNEFQTLIEAIPTKSADSWRVEIKAESDGLALTLEGPDYHRRTYRVFGEGAYDPIYLAALVRTEIRSCPSYPPQDVAFALAELARLGVPYDDTEIFSGRVLVDGEVFSSRRWPTCTTTRSWPGDSPRDPASPGMFPGSTQTRGIR